MTQIREREEGRQGRPIRVLFVCLGNICRSPSAEAVFRAYVEKQGAGASYEIDSAGLIAHHEGELPDGRMRAHAARRGYSLVSRSRPITYEDFFHYDYVIGMDASNRERLLALAPTEETQGKVSLLTDWLEDAPRDHIPDPYYGGAEGFEHVLDLIELCVPALFHKASER